MKVSEIREWDNVEITDRLEEIKEQQFRLRFQAATMTLDNPKLIQKMRRDSARLQTVLRERQVDTRSEKDGMS